MFFKIKKINDESGVVLFIVLMVAIIIMIFSAGILTQSMNEINYAQQQIDQITSTEWAKGVLWNAYSNGGNLQDNSHSWELLNNRNYVVYTKNTNDGFNGNWKVEVSYDSSQ